MKKGLLLGLTVSIAGASLAVGGAFALYKRNATDITINIGARTDTDLNYKVTDVAWAGGLSVMQPGVTNTLGFKIGAEKTAKSTYTQDVVVGKLTVEIESTNTYFIDYFDGKVTTTVNFTDDVFYGKTHKDSDEGPEYKLNVMTLAKSEGKLTGSLQIPVELTGRDVTMPISMPTDISNGDLKNLAEASYTVNIIWDAPTEFNFAYVTGSMNDWAVTDEWRMVPMLNTPTFEWTYKVDAAHKAKLVKDTEFKCRVGDTWSPDPNYKISDAESGKVTGIYWKGAGNAPTVSHE